MFEIGKEVVCIKTHSKGAVRKGVIYPTIDLGVKCKCGLRINVGLKSIHQPGKKVQCRTCRNTLISTGCHWFSASLFIPIDEITEIEVIEEKIKEPETLSM